ncbi:MAG: hypothetical protein IIW94_01540 [Clostridia bacterium]|nr:hypothetical protein [Clostridia bacterium]
MAINEAAVYQDLEDIYVLCIRKVVSEVCADLWRNMPEGAFGTFKKYDLENTKAVNAQKDQEKKEAEKLLKEGKISSVNYDKYKHIVAITSKAKSFKKFDFQACNNTLAYIEPVYTEIAKKYRFNYESLVNTAKELSRLRNKLAHPDPSDSPSKILGYQKNCINHMNYMFGMGLDTVKDENGATFYEQFQKIHFQYMEQALQRWYYLTDFLDLEHYDASRFLEVCATNNIKADKKDAKYLFCTSNLEKTVEILKNSLALSGDNVAAKAQVAPMPPAQSVPPTPQPVPQPKKSNKTPYIVAAVICALLLGGAIVAATVIPAVTGLISSFLGGTSSTPSAPQMPVLNNSSTVSQDTDADFTSSVLNDTSSEESNAGTGENQILPKHEQDVQALQHADDLALRNKTISVSVGDYITPPPALVWDNVTIYSQNTNIAVGENGLVKGVSPGTTYIIVESELGSSSAFCVVVKQ